MAETIAMIFVLVGGTVMVSIPIWALHKRQQALELRARREMEGIARLPLNAGERAVARAGQRKDFVVSGPVWGLTGILFLVGLVVAVSLSANVGAAICFIALVGFLLSIRGAPADEPLAKALHDPKPIGSQAVDADSTQGPKVPWLARLEVFAGSLLLPTGTILILADQMTAGLVVLGVWVIHMAVFAPLIIFSQHKRERNAAV